MVQYYVKNGTYNEIAAYSDKCMMGCVVLGLTIISLS